MTFWVAGAAIVGTALTASQAEDAEDAQYARTQQSVARQDRQFDLQREDSRPYRETGVRALGQYETEINRPTTSADVMQDPGYQFGLEQGEKALGRRVASMGGRVSGRALIGATRFGTDYASTGFGAAHQRRQDRLNRLAALAGIGQTATAGSAAAGQSSANAITGLLTSQGDADAGARMAQGSIWAGGGNQIAALYSRKPRGTDTSSFRASDPYRTPGYYGGDEGE